MTRETIECAVICAVCGAIGGLVPLAWFYAGVCW
jgi:hypothetical protein